MKYIIEFMYERFHTNKRDILLLADGYFKLLHGLKLKLCHSVSKSKSLMYHIGSYIYDNDCNEYYNMVIRSVHCEDDSAFKVIDDLMFSQSTVDLLKDCIIFGWLDIKLTFMYCLAYHLQCYNIIELNNKLNNLINMYSVEDMINDYDLLWLCIEIYNVISLHKHNIKLSDDILLLMKICKSSFDEEQDRRLIRNRYICDNCIIC